MDDEAAARALIQDIRHRKSVDRPGGLDENPQDLQESIRTLSDDLYSTLVRFLLELIQNADDNRYDEGVIPQVSIVYRTDGFLWIGSNERGFTETNVRSICRVRHSTKKVEGGRKGYIGEKGIGFKSVFSVADLVWVKSNALQFQFNSTQPLGMVTPQWCTFKSNDLINERTMFCLRVLKQSDRQIIEKEVVELEADLLLFLRQIRHINVCIQGEDGTVVRSHHLKRFDDVAADLRITKLSCTSLDGGDSTQESFVVNQHTAQGMPFEEKRPGVTESDILIAFPVDDALNPLLRDRRVCNFLPIKSFGFPFVLQADFMLNASREDILKLNVWNRALVSATIDLLVQSVQKLSAQQYLKYTWPKYLKFGTQTADSIFAGFGDRLLSKLRISAVLESEASQLAKPVHLQYAPAHLTDGQRPLLQGPTGLTAFAHHAYDFQDLEALGVPQQSPEDFLQLLHELVRGQPGEFRQCSDQWHSRLASAILAIGTEGVLNLKLIPARGGQWLASKGNKLFFPDIEDGTILPGGIEIQVVDDVTVQNPPRRRLFAALGVMTLDEARVCDLIIQQHSSKGQEGRAWSVEDVVEHAWFLFRAKTLPSHINAKKLLVASTDGKVRLGAHTYMDVPNSQNPVSKLLGSARTTVPFLHERYLNRPHLETLQDPAGAGTLLRKWMTWLHKSAGLRILPRLAMNGTVTPEFEMIIQTSTTNEWLQLLKNEPAIYSQELLASENDSVRVHLINCRVLCADGKRWPLKQVYLPTADVLSEPLATQSVSMLMTDDAQDARWSSLERPLSLRRQRDAELFISVLICMQQNRFPFTVDDVRRMYTGLARRYSPQVKQHFISKTLVFIDSPQLPKWVKLEECRWDAPAAIYTLYALNQRYKQNSDLFTRSLRLGNATAQDVVGELKKFSGRIDAVDTIRDLLKILSNYVEGGELNVDSLRGLTNRSIKILPVRIGDQLGLCSFPDNSWFVEDDDMPMLVETFQDMVRVVDCDYLTKRKPRTLLEKLGFLGNLLSQRYFIEHEPKGEVAFESVPTKVLRGKAEYLSRLVEEHRRKEALFRLSALEVRSADAIVIRKYVKVKGQSVYGRDEEGTITLKYADTSPVIFFSRNRTATDHIPFYQINEEFVEALEIQKRHRTLAMTILMQQSPELIESELERAGCGRAKQPTESNRDTVRSKVLDLTAMSKKKPALNIGNDRTLKIGSSVRFGAVSSASAPECHSTPAVNQSRVAPISGLDDSLSAPPSVVSLPNGYGRLGSSSRYDRPSGSSSLRGDPAHEGTGTNYNNRKLDLSIIHTQIEEAVALENDQGASSQLNGTLILEKTTATEAELAIGRAGESFVYQILKVEFGVGQECWTSSSRGAYPGLQAFYGDEAEHADFTISNADAASQMTGWLLNEIGVAAAEKWQGREVTYHIEVKTTAGHLSEPFEMSNNQVQLAKQWHASAKDVMIIVRVYHILSGSPTFHVYFDPMELQKTKGLRFEAKGGYWVMPG